MRYNGSLEILSFVHIVQRRCYALSWIKCGAVPNALLSEAAKDKNYTDSNFYLVKDPYRKKFMILNILQVRHHQIFKFILNLKYLKW